MADIKKTVDEKIVTIPFHGPIYVKGGIYGPVPAYKEKTSEISFLITRGYPVSEVLPDGTFLPLDLTNYNIDHTGDNGEFLKSINDPVTEPQTIDENGKVIGGKTADKSPETQDTGKTDGKVSVTATPAKADDTADKNSTVIGGSTSNSKAEKLDKK